MRFVWWLLGVTLAVGCTDGAGSCPSDLPQSCPADAATYKATIAPLIEDKCLDCHATGGVGGKVLETWDDVHSQRSEVLNQVYACRMPQPGAAPLTAAERQELLGWLVCGAQDN